MCCSKRVFLESVTHCAPRQPFLSLIHIKGYQGKCCDNLIHLITNLEVNERRDFFSLVCAAALSHESSDHQSILLQLQSA